MKFLNNIQLKTDDKITISLNHHSGGRDTVLIICPGCFMCKDAKPFVQMAEDFAEHFDVIAMDFRGHGQSGGLFTFTAREHLDLKAVIEYARKKYKQVVLIGFSLGAATAIIYAAKHKDVSGVIAVSAPWHADKLFEHAREPKKLVIFQDGLHAEDIYRKSKKKFIDTCMEWWRDIYQER